MNEVDKYAIKSGGITLDVSIVSEENEPKYLLSYPEFDRPTRLVAEELKDEIIHDVDKGMEPAADGEMRNRFRERLKAGLGKLLLGGEELDVLVEDQANNTYGLHRIEYLLRDPQLEEVKIDTAEKPVQVYHKKHGWMYTNIRMNSEQEIEDYGKKIGRQVGREVNINEPTLDAYLPSGDRVNVALGPVTAGGNIITIRMFARDPWTFTDFVKNKTISPDVLALLWTAIQYELNIIVSGGTGSGKTSMLNALMPFIPPNQQIISIEDTRELQLPKYLRWDHLVTRPPNPEGEGKITMLDLMVNTLRMRPDRIVMGEVRRHEEAETLFEAMHTGHSVYCTVHADTCRETIDRLTNEPIAVAPAMLADVHLNLVMLRDRVENIRRVYELGEFAVEGGKAKPNIIYVWDKKTDEIRPHEKPLRLYEELATKAGMSEDRVLEEIRSKKKIIEWMAKHDVRRVDDVGKLMKKYYASPKKIAGAAEKDADPKKILE